MNELNYIRSTLSDRDLLEQLAEEAAELSQAALKLIRADGGTNPTPIDESAAFDSLEEEFMDVLAVMAAYRGGYRYVWEYTGDSINRDKWERWYERVKGAQKK
jgi:hypothetical protein